MRVSRRFCNRLRCLGRECEVRSSRTNSVVFRASGRLGERVCERSVVSCASTKPGVNGCELRCSARKRRAGAWSETECSVGVVRPIISAFRADDRGSNPRRSKIFDFAEEWDLSRERNERKRVERPCSNPRRSIEASSSERARGARAGFERKNERQRSDTSSHPRRSTTVRESETPS
jgi:hypothetical protein